MSDENPEVDGGANEKAIAGAQLKTIVERIERVAAEKAGLAEDIKQIYVEAKGNGFDTKTLRQLVAARKRDAAKLKEERAKLGLYAAAIGMDEGIFG